MLVILKSLVKNIDILETMTPLSFLNFRSRLSNASGFQSGQFRMLEALLGMKDAAKVLQHYPENDPQRSMLLHFIEQKTIYDCLLGFVHCRGYSIPHDVLHRDVSKTYEEDSRVAETLTALYRQSPELSLLCEKFLDFDEGILEWRYRHIRMVERTIGFKKGTGGSSGVQYLESTLRHRAFPELWSIRSAF